MIFSTWMLLVHSILGFDAYLRNRSSAGRNAISSELAALVLVYAGAITKSCLNTMQVPSRGMWACFTWGHAVFFLFQCNVISEAMCSSCGAPFQSPVSRSGCSLTNNTLTQKLYRLRDLPFNKTDVLSDSKSSRNVCVFDPNLTDNSKSPPLWF